MCEVCHLNVQLYMSNENGNMNFSTRIAFSMSFCIRISWIGVSNAQILWCLQEGNWTKIQPLYDKQHYHERITVQKGLRSLQLAKNRLKLAGHHWSKVNVRKQVNYTHLSNEHCEQITSPMWTSTMQLLPKSSSWRVWQYSSSWNMRGLLPQVVRNHASRHIVTNQINSGNK